MGSAAGAGSRLGASEDVEHQLGSGHCGLPLLPCSKTAALRALERPNHASLPSAALLPGDWEEYSCSASNN